MAGPRSRHCFSHDPVSYTHLWSGGRWKAPVGSSGGSAEGASEGRQPLTGPLCRAPRRRPKQHKKKSARARRAQSPPLKGQALFYSPPSASHENPRPRAARRAGGPLEQINFEMLYISQFSFSRKMRFAVAVGGALPLTDNQCCLCGSRSFLSRNG